MENSQTCTICNGRRRRRRVQDGYEDDEVETPEDAGLDDDEDGDEVRSVFSQSRKCHEEESSTDAPTPKRANASLSTLMVWKRSARRNRV